MGKASRRRREKIQPILEARETEGLVKRARFYDRVCVMKEFRSRSQAYVDAVSTYLPHAVVIDVDPIYCYIKQKLEDMPSPVFDNFWHSADWLNDSSAKMPYPFVFMEYHDTEDGSWVGLLLLTQYIVEEDNKQEKVFIFRFELDDDWWKIEGASAQIVENMFGRNPEFAEVNHAGDILMSNEGQVIQAMCVDAHLKYIPVEKYDETVYLALLALTFINCRNIELIDLAPSPDDSAAYERKFGVPMTKYKVLRVNPIGKRYEREDKPQQQFDIMPLHIRRGHFKTFTEDAPRFGYLHPSNVGTFWVEATAVGNAKNGVVVKDYKVTT